MPHPMAHLLGRIPNPPDERDFLMRDSPRFRAIDPHTIASTKNWATGPVLDQGQTPHCVGFAGAAWMGADPVMDAVANATGEALYAACKQVDGMPNEDGSNSRALFSVLKAQGRIGRYSFASAPIDIQTWVCGIGPVLIGIPWPESFFDPDAEGKLQNVRSQVAGGHELIIVGRPTVGWYRLQNSWNTNWGNGGFALIRESDLAYLIGQGGDAAGLEELALTPPPPLPTPPTPKPPTPPTPKPPTPPSPRPHPHPRPHKPRKPKGA